MLQIKLGRDGDSSARVRQILAFPFSIGRDPANDWVIDDLSISKHHCRIERREDGSLWLVDLESTNGILAWGRLVRELAIPLGAKIPVFLGEIELELNAAPGALEDTKRIDVNRLHRRADRFWLLFPTAFLYFLALEWLDRLRSPNPESFPKMALGALETFQVVFGLAVALSLTCKLFNHQYRFKRSCRILFFGVSILMLDDTLFSPLLGQYPDPAIQHWVLHALTGGALIVGVVVMLKEVFPKLRWSGTMAVVLGAGGLIWGTSALSDHLSDPRTVNSEPAPSVGYPVIALKRAYPVDELVDRLHGHLAKMEQERAEYLKLR